MKAIRVHSFGDPDVMQIEDLPDPTPGPGQVLVDVQAVGVNPVETYIRSGAYPRRPDLPYTPGTDAAGIVLAVGQGVPGVSPGDRVYTSGSITGAYAQQALCSSSQVHLLPPRVDFNQGAALGIPYATAYRALFQKAHAIPGETLLVHGASGGVGVAAVQLARAAGLRVIGTAGTPEGAELVSHQGAHHVLRHDEEGYLDELARLAPAGVNLILEMLANINLGRDLTSLASGGRVVVIGSRGTVEIDPRQMMAREASVMGMVLFNASEAELAVIHSALAAGLENGSLHPVIDETLPLIEAPRAHERVMEGGSGGKIVLLPYESGGPGA